MTGADLTVSVDGTEVLTVRDETYASGTIGFRATGDTFVLGGYAVAVARLPG